MARRARKSSTRRARQRRHLQQTPRPPAPQPEALAEAADTVAPAATPAASSLPRASSTTHRGRPADPRFQVAGPSRLSERAIAEYHYVQRDLRNIGVLVVILVALLAAGALIVNLLGIGQV